MGTLALSHPTAVLLFVTPLRSHVLLFLKDYNCLFTSRVPSISRDLVLFKRVSLLVVDGAE